MKAYGIFAGGGVKGAALAGCLAAAQDRGVEFVGYGGTSAGAIIALLATVGYRGDEIRDLMLDRLLPGKLLDDGNGKKLAEAQEYLSKAAEIIGSGDKKISKFCSLRRLHKEAGPLAAEISTKLGLYEGKKIQQILLKLIQEKIATLKNHHDITFQDLAKLSLPPLKIVASDITICRAATYSIENQNYSASVLEAVRASISYPFLFVPNATIQQNRLADGGLASNLPSFLFSKERETTLYDVFAFDLMASKADSSNTLIKYFIDLLGTALEASDDLFIQEGSGVHRIPVPITNPEISTLKFDLNQAEVLGLYQDGYAETSKFLNAYPRLSNAKGAGNNLKKGLQIVYGDRKLFEPTLWALTKMILERTKARELRATIMLPTGEPDEGRMVTYDFNFRKNDGDADLFLGSLAGCQGRSFQAKEVSVADLDECGKNPDAWGLDPATLAKMPQDRHSMISAPIFGWTGDNNKPVSELPILGVLSVDSSTLLADTSWVDGATLRADQTPPISEEMRRIMTTWADIFSVLLRYP